MAQYGFGFWDNCTCIGSTKFNLSWREYSSSAVNVLKYVCSSSSRLTQRDAFAEFCLQIFDKKYFRRHFREYWLKSFVTLSRFWLLRGFGWIRLKRKNCNKNLFQIMLNEVLKSYIKWHLLIWKQILNKK